MRIVADKGGPAMTRIVVTSCCSIENRADQPAWDEIAAAHAQAPLDLLLHLGDNVYMHNSDLDESMWQPGRLMRNYSNQFAQPQFKAVLDLRRPTMAIWDDHDYGINDANGGDVVEGSAHRLWTTALFNYWWHFRVGDRDHPHNIHCAATFGDVRVIALDVRSWRKHPGPEAAVLGDAQEAWLWKALAEPWDGYTIVASGSTLRIGDESNGPTEKLLHHSAFAKTLEAAMRARRRTLFLGGDLHYNAVAQGDGYVEIMTSGVAQKTWATKKDTNNWALLDFGDDGVAVEFHGGAVKIGKERHKRIRIDSDWKVQPA
jgi:phosphodiesterase/alkaline phosphatase D-like protein